ncbi:Myblike DNAbinding domain-containing protein [Dissophora globulifera]|uniref:Myblike DNAbinding domain-containing protein n=1 Tax=Dissophora globulifera TaxID=979702 RepID=A0A9P6RU77_9FUNG|nr:Myblike DNAbinding domain-containing protein [Dissophora globulifera]
MTWPPTTTTTTSGTSTAAAGKSNAAAPQKLQRSRFIDRTFTPEMDAAILEMRLEGNTWEEIAVAIGREPSVVRHRYTKSLDPAVAQEWTSDKLESLNALVAQGKSWRNISEQLLVTQSAAREKWISINQDLIMAAKARRSPRRLRMSSEHSSLPGRTFRYTGMVTRRRHRWSDEMDAVLLDLHSRGLSWREMGNTFGMVPSTVYTRYRTRVVPKLAKGWVPPKMDLSNTPYYLLRDRSRTSTVALTSISSSDSSLASNQEAVNQGINTNGNVEDISKLKHEIIGVVGEDYMHRKEETSSPSLRKWTKEEDDAIIQSREKGLTFTQIGIAMDIDPRLCYKRFFTVLDPSLALKEWTPYLIDKLLVYVEQGMPWSSIALDLGFHREVCKMKYREFLGSLSTSTSKSALGSASTLTSSTAGSSDNSSQESGGRTATTAAGYSSSALDLDSYSSEQSVHDDMEDLDDADDDDDGQLEDDIIDDLRGDYTSHSLDDSDEDDDSDGDVEGDNDDDLLASGATEDSEAIAGEGMIHTGRWSKRQKHLSEPSKTTTLDKWDQDLLLREVMRTWTPEEETALIQHVLRNGTRGWQEISSALSGQHSAEECRAYWKFLDMPVHRPREVSAFRWEPHQEAHFWRLWVETGSNFEEIARQLGKSKAKSVDETSLDGSSHQQQRQKSVSSATAQDCEQLFTKRTLRLQRLSKGKPESTFQRECIELALARSKPPRFKWDKERSVRLQKLVRQRLMTRGVQMSWINWKWVARHVGGGVAEHRCNIHWRHIRKLEMDKENWTEQDTLLLEQGIREIGTTFNMDSYASAYEHINDMEPSLAGFRAIQKFYLPDRSVETLQRKYYLLSDKALGVTVQEYMAIMDAVDEYGLDQWDKVAEHMRSQPQSLPTTPSTSASVADQVGGSQSGVRGLGLAGWTKAPCRRVWEASYRHHVQYTQWTGEEDQDLQEAVGKLGQGNWVSVARFFPGKSGWQCRLRWCQLTDPSRPVTLTPATDATLAETASATGTFSALTGVEAGTTEGPDPSTAPSA